MRRQRLILHLVLCGIVCVSNATAFAQSITIDTDEEPLFLFRGARPLGLGNAYEAVSDDVSAIHYNPAGLAQIDERKWQILIIRARATEDLIDEADTLDEFIRDTIEPLTDADDPLTDPRLAAERQALVDRAEQILVERHGIDAGFPSIGIVEPLSVGGYKAALGLALYTQVFGSAQIGETGLPWSDAVMAMFDNFVVYRVTTQLSLATAFAMEFPVNQPFLQTANAGITVRLIRRGTFTDIHDPFRIEDILDSETFKRRYFDIEDDDNFADFVRKNVDSKTGFSVDLGTMLFPIDGVRIGIAWRNFASNIDVEYDDSSGREVKEGRSFPGNFVVAAAVKPFVVLEKINPTLDVTLAASIDNPNGDDRLGDFELGDFSDHIHLGAEAILWPKGALSLGLRAGNNQGFTTYGATVRLFRFLNFDIGRYGNLEADWWFASTEFSF